jgi:hypothetical protein
MKHWPLGVVTWLWVITALADDPPAPASAPSPCERTDGCIHALEDPGAQSWVDTSYEYVTARTDLLAQRLDSFFGEPHSDLESADSVLRLLGEVEQDQQDGSDGKIRLRGKVDLPQIDRRLSLVFFEEGEDRRDVAPAGEHEDSDVGLQYRLSERERSRLYLSVGTNASLEFRSSLRYRYLYPIREDLLARFSERVYYKEDEGIGALTRLDLDYSLTDNRILRWTADVDYGEETDGAEWGTRLSYLIRLNDKEALSHFVAMSGQTDPEDYTSAYALGVRYRRNMFRPWVFFELEPSHEWRRDAPADDMDPAWVLTLRIELLEELGNRHARSDREPVQAGPP